MTRQIKFYKSGDPHGWMSNFGRFPIMMDGLEWPTSEHYYQAQKFNYNNVPPDGGGAYHSNFLRGREVMEEITSIRDQAARPLPGAKG